MIAIDASNGATHSPDGTARLLNKDVGVGRWFTAPYTTSKFSGMKFSIELHNRHMQLGASGQDLDLLS